MGDYKWLTCATGMKCDLCKSEIRTGDGFYYEAGKHEHLCRDCGRSIRKNGEETARMYRHPLMRRLLGDVLDT
jgi:hypothetical protein